jgi:hypothetical protein
MTDPRTGRRYRVDGLTRRDARWRIAVGLLDTIDRIAAEQGVPASTVAEDALALGCADLLVRGALASGRLELGAEALLGRLEDTSGGHAVDTKGNR